MRAPILLVFAALSVTLVPRAARAQAALKGELDVAPRGWQVAPLRLPVAGRPNQRIPFELTVTSTDRTTRQLEVRVVRLEQQESGTIGFAAGEPHLLSVSLDGPARVSVAPGATLRLRGHVRPAPQGPAFRAFGVLVSEASAAPRASSSRNPTRTSLGVQFATRYLCRVEVEVNGARRPQLSQVVLERGALVDRQGRAEARVHLANPSDAIIAFEVDAQLFEAESGRRVGPSFPLVLPIKENRAGPLRTGARCYPGARLRLGALLPEPILPGRYRLVATLRSGRERSRGEFEVVVGPDDFPAQAAITPRVVASVTIAPPRLELSVARGGRRMEPLVLENHGDVAVHLTLAAVAREGGEPVGDLVVRPARLTLAPGTSRRAAVIYTGRGDLAAHRYGELSVRVEPEDGSVGGEQRVTVAVLGHDGEPARPLLSALEPLELTGVPAFRLSVRNAGGTHLPLEARLSVRDAYGRALEEVPAGFGAWLLPGDAAPLVFRLARPLPPGTYSVDVQLSAGPGAAPLTAARRWTVPAS